MSKHFAGFPVLVECAFGRYQTGIQLSKFTPVQTVINRLRAAGERVTTAKFDDQAKRWIANGEFFK